MARLSRSGVVYSHRPYSRGQAERGWARHYDLGRRSGNLTQPPHPIWTIVFSGMANWNRWRDRTDWRRGRRG